MGFLDQSSTTKTLTVTVLLPGFQAVGTLKVIGVLQTFINDERRGVFALTDAALYGLERGNPAGSLRVPELFIRKEHCHAIALAERQPADQLGLMPRTEHVALYTSHYALQGQCYMGTEALIADFLEAAKSLFIVMSEASFFPLFVPQTAILAQAPIAFVHRATVRMHHRL